MMRRRVVVTGLGAVTPLGNNVKSSWANLKAGRSGIKKLLGPDYERIPCRVAGVIQEGTGDEDLDISLTVGKSEQRTMSRASILGLVASSEAIKNAKWAPTEKKDKESTGVCIGMGMSDLGIICEAAEAFKQGYSKVSPYFVPRILPNMPAGLISMKYGFQGPNHTVSTACATGCHAIGDAFRFIQHNQADVMICGGTEASITPLALAGFCRLRALSTSFNDSPSKASRPFDERREGFVMGEGSAVIVLEELHHAVDRGANIYAEILGYGLSGDASHMTAPHEKGDGALLAMSRALADAQLDPKDISYVNAHATSTPLGDAIELKAVSRLITNASDRVAISSTKGSHGHLLGAAGNLETLFTILACSSSTLPPTVNLDNPCQEAAGFNCVPNIEQKWSSERRVALKNSFGFGGTNACLALSNFVG